MARRGRAVKAGLVPVSRGTAGRGWAVTAWQGAVRQGSAGRGPVRQSRIGSAGQGKARHGAERQSRLGWSGLVPARPGPAVLVRQVTSRRRMAGMARKSVLGLGEAVEVSPGKARRGAARHGLARCGSQGEVWQGRVRRGLEWRRAEPTKRSSDAPRTPRSSWALSAARHRHRKSIPCGEVQTSRPRAACACIDIQTAVGASPR